MVLGEGARLPVLLCGAESACFRQFNAGRSGIPPLGKLAGLNRLPKIGNLFFRSQPFDGLVNLALSITLDLNAVIFLLLCLHTVLLSEK